MAEEEQVYNLATELWFKHTPSDKQHGHPGMIGPSSTDTEWNKEEAYIESAIVALEAVLSTMRNRKTKSNVLREIAKFGKANPGCGYSCAKMA